MVPPNTGICHQVNLEYLARVVESREQDGRLVAFPDTLVGTDSHTTMVNGLGVLGWGVGGIEAEAAMLGEPVSMLVPQVVGLKLTGELSEPATATDLVLTVTEILRRTGVVGKFVEYFGPGLSSLTIADRATIANMSPEYGATCGFWPVDEQTVAYLELTGRDAERLALVEAYCKANLLWHEPDDHPRLLAGRRARSRHRRAEHRGPSAAAGPRAASRGAGSRSPRRSPGSRSGTATAPTTRRWPTASRRRTPRRERPPASRRWSRRPRCRGGAGPRRRCRSSWTASRFSSTTEAS